MRTFNRFIAILAVVAVLIGAGLPRSLADPPPDSPPPLNPGDFSRAVPQGFGDRQNSMVWSMQWWRGKLYVGTSRSYGCYLRAILVTYYPWQTYPPLDSEIDCTPLPEDLPLGAEIWQWTPETDTWKCVYQSPRDLEIPGHPGKFVARSIGFRDMTVFTEPDGTEALYVAGFSARDLYPDLPLPQLLRTTDGRHFEAAPPASGTFWGSPGTVEGLVVSGINRLTVFDGRMFATIGGAYGHGVLFEAANPAAGLGAFRRASPEGVTVTVAKPFQGALYVATGSNPIPGEPAFTVQKTTASGQPPYTFTTVIPAGGYRWPAPSTTVVAMHAFDDGLWLSTNRRSEMLRINPDDSWDLLVGNPRLTPSGWLYPLSGLGDGFDWSFNIHIHHMQDHNGWLYAATNDQSNTVPWRNLPEIAARLQPRYGFDLYRTGDGGYFYPVTVSGFEANTFDFSGRTMASTPYGFFLGTMNYHYGLNIWRGVAGSGPPPAPAPGAHAVYLPLVVRSMGNPAARIPARAPVSVGGALRVELESIAGQPVLVWPASYPAGRFRVYRSDLAETPPAGSAVFGSVGSFQAIGTTTRPYFVDETAVPDQVYHYYVVAELTAGGPNQISNLVRVPNLYPPVTFADLLALAAALDGDPPLTARLEAAKTLVEGDSLAAALTELDSLAQDLTDPSLWSSPGWRLKTPALLVGRLARRVELAQAGMLAAADLLGE